jgi:hypothetical protein
MKTDHAVRSWRRSAAALLAGAALVSSSPAHAQHGPLAMHSEGARDRTDELFAMSGSLARGGYAVVVDLDANELSFRQGRTVLWSAPIGTGTGLRLETDEGDWDFSTPDGIFQVQYKEQDPVWIAPDWYFIENGFRVPPANHPSRYFEGGLGVAAVYIGHDLAIHGTDKPELLGQRVSHGCIRLANKHAQRLFHNVQIGTEVLIVGGEDLEPPRVGRNGNDPSAFSGTPSRRPLDAQMEHWKRSSTPRLSAVLAEELWMPEASSRWTEVVSVLLDRALKRSDERALTAILMGIADLPNVRVEREYRTFLADAFARSPMRMLAALSKLDRGLRDRAASAIVTASAGLYAGDLSSPSAPWPTSRVPRESVREEGRLGWNALARAESGHRPRAEAERKAN